MQSCTLRIFRSKPALLAPASAQPACRSALLSLGRLCIFLRGGHERVKLTLVF